jgi:hypothetical protein
VLKPITLVFAALALCTVAFAQDSLTISPAATIAQIESLQVASVTSYSSWYYQVGYAANLNIGDSVVNISNDGSEGGFSPNTNGAGNVCVNIYTFDPSEEEISCCSCLVTPNGLYSLSAKNDLINDVLTPATPNSIVIKLLATQPGTTAAGAFTVCDPALRAANPTVPLTFQSGMLAWGTTLEPAASPGTYGPVNVKFLTGPWVGTEAYDLWTVCNFVQSQGTGFGICNSCGLGALGGGKR